MMIGLVVFGGTQGIHGMGFFNKYVKPTKPTRQQLSNATPAFLSKLFNIQSRNITTQLWESDLAAKVAATKARNSLSELGNRKYSQIFSAGQQSPRSWMPNPNARRMKLVNTDSQIHADVFGLYGV